MAVKTFYLTDTLASDANHLLLQDGGSAPTQARTGTGWVVGTVGTAMYARMDSQTKLASTSHTSTVQPNSGPNNTLGDCYRSTDKLSGTFATGNWTFSFSVQGQDRATSTHDGRLRVHIWQSANPTGSTPTDSYNQTKLTTNYTNLTNSTAQTITSTFDPGITITLNNEYLFVVVAHQIMGAGDDAACDTLLCVGSNSKITTTDFTPAVVSVTDSGTDTESLSILAFPTVTDSGTTTESLSILSFPTITDSGTDTETVNILAFPVTTDSGSGTDSVSVTSASYFSVTDAGTGTETINTLAFPSVADSGIGTDSVSITISNIIVSDTASGSESVAAGAATTTKSLADRGIGTESVKVLKGPYFVLGSSSVSGPGVTSRTVTVPAGTTNGDLMLAICVIELASGSVTAHANWGSPILNTPLSTRTHTQVVYARIANSEPADYTFSWSSCECMAAILTFRDAILPTQYQAQVNNTSVAEATAPTLTPTSNNSLVVWLGSIMSGSTWTPPTNYSEILDIRSSTASTNMGMAVAIRNQSTATATGASFGTASAADFNIGTHVILAPSLMGIVIPDTVIGSEVASYEQATDQFDIDVSDTGLGTETVATSRLPFTVSDSGTITELPVIQVPLILTDSFAGTDTLIQLIASMGISDISVGMEVFGSQTSLNQTDTASGQEALNLLAFLLQGDSFTGLDSISSLLNHLITTDSGSFLELAIQLGRLFNIADAMTASDAITALQARAVVLDQGTTSEGVIAAVRVTLADILTASDAVTVITSTLITLLESGYLADSLSISVSPIHITDAGLHSDAVAIATLNVILDNGTGSSSVLILVSSPVVDAGSTVESTQVNVRAVVPENAYASDIINLVLENIKQILEVANGFDDIGLLLARVTVQDGITGLDVTSASVFLDISESGSLSDIILLSCLVALSDIASSTDGIQLQAQVRVADLGQALVVLGAITNLFQVSDLASATDIVFGYDSATTILTIGFTMRTRSMAFTMNQRSMAFTLKSRVQAFSIQGE